MQTLNKAIIAVLALAALGAGAWFLASPRGGEQDVLVPLGPLRVELPPVVSAELKELVQAHEFRFRSELREPLRVASTTVSCTCTTATVEPEVIEPGGEMVVRTVTVLERAAGRHATIWVRFEDGRGVKMHLTASFRRPVILSTRPSDVRAELESQELIFTLIRTASPAAAEQAGKPGTPAEPEFAGPPPAPEILHDRGGIVSTFGGWSPATVDATLFGPEGPPPGTVAHSGEVRLSRGSDHWPTVLTIRTPGADPLELNLRDLLPGE